MGPLLFAAIVSAALAAAAHGASGTLDLGDRPQALAAQMDKGELKDALAACRDGPFYRTRFSIGHRGAPRTFPEHTRESYLAAARQGAGVIECDVTFTRDRALVCRHSQCDLHTTTNILVTDLAEKCSRPFMPAGPDGKPASARCCTSDITLAELETLCGKMDAADPLAATAEEYVGDVAQCGALMSHAESIALFERLGVAMMPELKAPSVAMPYQGDYTHADYAQQLIDEYRDADIPPRDVWPQSFRLEDIRYWIESNPAFGRRAVFLDGRDDAPGFDPNDIEALEPSMQALAAQGVQTLAPPVWMLLDLNDDGEIVPSAYARAARGAGLALITWTLERSGSLADGGGYYYQSITDAIDNDGDVYTVLDVLARDVGVIGVFSDWPATVTYYANCMDLQ